VRSRNPEKIMTKSTQRGRHASEQRSAVRQKRTRASESPRAKEGLYVKTDITPEQLFQAWSRNEREALIEMLIESLDAADGDFDLEYGADDEPNADNEPSLGFPESSAWWRFNRFLGYFHENECLDQERSAGGHEDRELDEGEREDDDSDLEDDRDDEPILAAPENHATVPLDSGLWGAGQRRDESCDQSDWAQGAWNDCEGDDCADDREDVCEDEGAEHDGREPDVDGEPSLGWTVDGVIGNSDGMDREADGSYLTDAAQQRYDRHNRYAPNRNRDGKHVDAERGYGGVSRRLTNLSDRQRTAIAPRVDRDEVRL
jgi:hypothetical protein